MFLSPQKSWFTNFNRLSLAVIIAWFYSFSIVVDTFNGFLLAEYSVGISAFYKAALLALVMFFIITKNKKTLVVPILLSWYFCYLMVISQDIFIAISGVDWLVRFTFIIFAYFFFKYIVEQEKYYLVAKCAQVYFVVITLNLFAGAMGLGYSQYTSEGEGIGTKGFFYAGNELSVTYCLSAALYLNFKLIEKNYLAFVFLAIVFMTSSLFIATKVAFISSFAVALGLIFIYMARGISELKIKNRPSLLMTGFFISALISLPIAIYVALFVIGLYERMSYFYDKYGGLRFIFSGRDDWASEALDIFSDQGVIKILFGSGTEWRNLTTFNKSVEIDAIDFLLNYGIVGLIITYGTVLAILCLPTQNPNWSRPMKFIILLILSISLTSGHVLYSAMGGPLIGAVLASINIKQKKKLPA